MCKSPTYKLNWKCMYDISWDSLPHKIYLTRYMSTVGMNNFATTQVRKWFDWDKKHFDRSLWYRSE